MATSSFRYLFFLLLFQNFSRLLETTHTILFLLRIPHVRNSHCHEKAIFLCLSYWPWIIMEGQCYTGTGFCNDVIKIIFMFWSPVLSCCCYLLYHILHRDSTTCITHLFCYSVFSSCWEIRWFLSLSSPKRLPLALNQSLLTSKMQLLIFSVNILLFSSSDTSSFHLLKCSTFYGALTD